MANTKVSALTAAAAAAAANELPINEAGTSKKLTAAQLKTFVNTAPVFAAGAAGANTAPKLTAGTVNTTPEAGAIEYDGKVVYLTPEANNRGVLGAEYVICLSSDNTLANSASEQALFDSVGNGALTLPVGTYKIEGLLLLTSMSSSSGNGKLDLLGAGTATIAAQYAAIGTDNSPDSPGAASITLSTLPEIASVNTVSASANTNFSVYITGIMRVTAAGTIIPSITLVNAAAAVVETNSYFSCKCIGSETMQTVGQWS